ncbi:MAG: hypothetical protein JSW26_25685 [Desulfobacterales bacterium]|nr:MAG: hypothetical protein JSW26_25685 [Desulfobacterales bacterium]
MPMYEIRYLEKREWKEISAVELMDDLYKFYKRVTPAIKEMIKGREFQTPDAVYRIRLKGGEHSKVTAA